MRLVDRAAQQVASRADRRGFLVRAAVFGSAMSIAPVRFLLRPGSALAACKTCLGDCTSGSTCCDGWTTFCCTINNGVNGCPTGSVPAGWWKCSSSTYCSGGPRYYVDCNGLCTDCTTGCTTIVQGDNDFLQGTCSTSCDNCTSQCANCSCGNRSTCRNRFRYGNCNVNAYPCVGRVKCRVALCTVPWQTYSSCIPTPPTGSGPNYVDDRTCSHTASCL